MPRLRESGAQDCKEEQIRMAKFNETFYHGVDQYSDGEVEEEILRLVRQGMGLDDILQEELSYPILYHLSKVRENIFLWYPFAPEARILEVGAGCGAVTGILCEKAKEVVAVELSKRRATINFERNRQRANLEIVVGNLNEIPLREEFDYIILNGVFEYAGSFTEGEQPYEEFLKQIARRLKPEGTILIAIENRLGAKYFAGAPEDHTDRYFLGLDRYDGVKSVRTFSKTELEDLCARTGLICNRFYYPYPDYKFPYEIFTDESVNTPLYGRPMFQFSEGKLALFYEAGLCQTLAKEGVADKFANSFLVEVKQKHSRSEREIQYVKLSCDRNPGFRIYTAIWEEAGKRYVGKYPVGPKAAEHLLRMNQRDCAPGRWSYLGGRQENGAIIYDYLEEATLDDLVSVLMTRREGERIEALIADFYQVFLADSRLREDYGQDPRFIEVFGEARCAGAKKCAENLDIDLIFDNIFCLGKTYAVIDAEWVFPFAIPVEYVMWRVLNELFYKHPGLSQIVDHRQLEEKYGIRKEDAAVFKRWEIHFAYQYVGSYSLQKYEREPLRLELEKIARYYSRARSLVSKFYINTGNGYNENETVTVQVPLTDGRFRIRVQLPTEAELLNLRWDPGAYPCRCRVERAESLGKELVCVPDGCEAEWRVQESEETAADEPKQAMDLFLTPDPRYEISKRKGRLGKLSEVTLEGEICYLSWEELMRELDKAQQRKQEQIAAGVARALEARGSLKTRVVRKVSGK